MAHDQPQAQSAALAPGFAMEANIDRACGHCGAPATFKHHPSIEAGWPGCFVADDDPRRDQLVGPVCPNCDTPRQAAEPLGEIARGRY